MRWLISNLSTFLLALILALAVWISAVTAANPDEVRAPIKVPLEIIGQDPALIVTSALPANIEVTLRAPRSVWEQLTVQEKPVRAIVDLSNLSSGEHQIDIRVQISVRPTQIVLTDPTSIVVTLERLASLTLPIDLSLQGEPAIGFQAGTPRMDAQTVVVSGPESLLNKAERARVLVNFGGARESIDQAIPIKILDGQNATLNGLTITPENVVVQIPISQQGGFRDVAVKVVVNGQVSAGYRLENISVFPPIITVFASNPELVRALPGVIETQPLNLQDAKEDISTRLALNLPPDITIVGSQTVEVKVDVSPIQTSITLSNQPVEVVGLPAGWNAVVAPQTVDVIVSGPLPLLDALTPQDVIIKVDVSKLQAGTYQLTPLINVLIEKIVIESILPSAIEVTLYPPGAPIPTP
ncbi:MAG: CdaR family protein [Anaerolineaceae bacterium]|jgi:YbbR domain-containing protein|nr:hypothetical protein [Anaerolineales bacterium]MEB2334303.1 CdaR family protein [Anaerolineaceae bacterium]OQY88205.1 MAG: hypothetical protein B6D38_10365 [Anaerolineae bacterium UTCFX1]